MDREPECYNVFKVFTTVMGVLASLVSLVGLVGLLAACTDQHISPTICLLLLISGMGLLLAAAAGGLFLNLVKNVFLVTLQQQLILRQLSEINPKEQARREAKFQPRSVKVPNVARNGKQH